ncbi:hypothetical protein K7432_017527 [Basidiobolus ranarum]|uniref:Uncharacterized protein n=1 Tax=Basidiobolus ranarum TaxID=34480 RepID=A0ABR2WD92_9FUNG
MRDFSTIDDLIAHMKSVDRSIYYTWKNVVKKDVSKFCTHCFRPKPSIECMALDHAHFV